MPSEMVVWASAQVGTTMSIQVLSSRSGHVVRTLALDFGLFNSTPHPTTSPDGTVYYDKVTGATHKDRALIRQWSRFSAFRSPGVLLPWSLPDTIPPSVQTDGTSPISSGHRSLTDPRASWC